MTIQSIYVVLSHISVASVLIPIGFCLKKFQTLNKTLWALFILLVFSLISDILCLIFVDNISVLNTILNLYTIIESTLILYIYRREFPLRAFRLLVLYIWIAFVIFTLIVSLFKGFSNTDNLICTVEAIMTIGLSLLIAINTLLDDSQMQPLKTYFFWINSSFLIYFCASLLMFIEIGYLETESKETFSAVLCISVSVSIFCNFLRAIGISKIS